MEVPFRAAANLQLPSAINRIVGTGVSPSLSSFLPVQLSFERSSNNGNSVFP